MLGNVRQPNLPCSSSFSIEDILQKYVQFEDKDTDILIETHLETSSFFDKISDKNYKLNDEKRQKVVFFFVIGLAMKAIRQHGMEESVQYFERAAYEDSSFADPRYQVALYHLRCIDDSTTAMEHLEKVLDLESETGEILRLLDMY